MIAASSFEALLSQLANHVWQSTLVAFIAWMLTLALKRNHARARYWLWLAASAKFLVPFSLLMGISSSLRVAIAPAMPMHSVSVVVEEFSQPFRSNLPSPLARALVFPDFSWMPAILLAVWLCGCAGVALLWWSRWRRIAITLRRSQPLQEGREWEALQRVQRRVGVLKPIQILSSPSTLEPGVFGFFRPLLLLPAGIANRLTDEQLDAIVAHELCHVKNRDNFNATFQMAIEAFFWFHPLVWWLGARLVEERERACDEEVLRLGSEPEIYAESILNVCKFYLESPVVCVSGITGADLKRRIESIMSRRTPQKLEFAKKLLLAGTALAAIAVPVAIGALRPLEVRIDSQNTAGVHALFVTASIQPSQPGSRRIAMLTTPDGRFTTTNTSVKMLMTFAYDVREHQISGGPAWLETERYDVDAKAGAHTKGINEIRAMLRTLLEDHFDIRVRHASAEQPVFEIFVDKGGVKMAATASDPHKRENRVRMGPGMFDADSATMPDLERILSNELGRSVVDRTGLTGAYHLRLKWEPSEHPGKPIARVNIPAFLAALREQAGLNLEPQSGPVDLLIVDRAEKPTAGKQ